MPLEVRPLPKLTYKLRLSPQMRLSLNLLALPLVRLKEYIKEEVEKNPLLEIRDDESSQTRDEISSFGTPPEKTHLTEWTEEDEEKRAYKESLITKPLTLQDHLLRHLSLLASTEEDLKIGISIIGNIDEDGYLRSSIEEIAESCKTTGLKAERVLALIQTLDPQGVGARDLRECLLLQLKAKGEEKTLAGQIVDKHLPLLAKKRYGHIARALRASVEGVKEAMKEIARLEPKPGRSFDAERPQTILPDATVKKTEEGYGVVLNDWELPRIGINEKYKKMLRQKDISQEVQGYLQERLKSAVGLLGAVKRRQETIQRVIEEIVSFQRDLFDKGPRSAKPMTLSQIADRAGRHKSTVSRAIANKYLSTPYGILELRSLFNSGLGQKDDETVSSKSLKLKIRDWIRDEDKKKPLADQALVALFKQDGITISRRTVTKYRNQLKLLHSQFRRE